VLRSIEALLWYDNYDYLNNHRKGDIRVKFESVNEVEMDEMGNFVGDKTHQSWLWWAIDRTTGEPLAFQLGIWEHESQDELLALL
jgi:transposase-like protein